MLYYNLEEIKKQITIDNVYSLLLELGAEPQLKGDVIISKTLCHHHLIDLNQAGHKLYYYNNSSLFHCYSRCTPATFDIFELILKIKENENQSWTLNKSIEFIAKKFNITIEDNSFDEDFFSPLEDWKILNKQQTEPSVEKRVELKVYDNKILKYLPQPHIIPWEKEGIVYEVEKARGIKYNPSSQGVIIPHYDINNNLIGIRERTLIKENEQYGKYRPAIINNIQYNHPLGFNLYNLNNSKNSIKQMKKAIIVEGEKSCLLYASFFGLENDISCAVCGSSLQWYQVKLLMSLGVEEIIIAFDKQFQAIGDKEWEYWTKKLTDIHTKYSKYFQISYLFDKGTLLGYKESPLDRGPDTFLQLFKERVYI